MRKMTLILSGCWGCLVFLLVSGCAWANLSKPWIEGEPVSEPIGHFRSVHIRSETLRFDFRLLNQRPKKVKIEAQYNIENMGKAFEGDLFFVAPGLVHGKVWLDGTALASKREKRVIPKKWQLVSGKALGVAFRAKIKPGKHVIKVSYVASPREYIRATGLAVRVYSIRYVFGPARRWASFGKLSVHAVLPDGWTFRKNELQLREGWKGWVNDFKGLPKKDAVVLSVHPPEGLLPFRFVPIVLSWIGLCLLLLWGARRVAPWVLLPSISRGQMWLRGAGFAVGGALVMAGLNWIGVWWTLRWIDTIPHVVSIGYGALIYVLIGVFLLPLTSLLVVPLVWWWLFHRKYRVSVDSAA